VGFGPREARRGVTGGFAGGGKERTEIEAVGVEAKTKSRKMTEVLKKR
jgi:hypothetical protein